MFIVKQDIYSRYPSADFAKLIDSDDTVWQNELSRVIEDVSGYLRARYDVDSIFISIETHSDSNTYSQYEMVQNSTTLYTALQDVPSGIAINKASYWEAKDIRNQKIVEIVIDILLYNIIPRLNNYDIPATIKERYNGNTDKDSSGAIGWLRRVAKGEVEPDLPLRDEGQDDQTGNVTMYGSATEVKNEIQTF